LTESQTLLGDVIQEDDSGFWSPRFSWFQRRLIGSWLDKDLLEYLGYEKIDLERTVEDLPFFSGEETSFLQWTVKILLVFFGTSRIGQKLLV
jgi:hypothetical protein